MSHPLEQIIRNAYIAVARDDIDGYLQPCATDFTFNVPGNGGICGIGLGKKGLLDVANKAVALGTFHEEVDDVLANDWHAVVLARHRSSHDGAPKDYRPAQVYEVRNGRLIRCLEQPQDPGAYDAWGSSSLP